MPKYLVLQDTGSETAASLGERWAWRFLGAELTPPRPQPSPRPTPTAPLGFGVDTHTHTHTRTVQASRVSHST